MKNYNCPHKNKPHYSQGMCKNCRYQIQYTFDPEFRRKAKERAKKHSEDYYKDPKLRKRKKKREKKWRKRHPLHYRKQIALCNIKNVLKEGYDEEFVKQIKKLIRK